MNVKTYQASSIAEAVAKVKQDLGPTAVILHTRSFKRGGIMGVGARTVVEITAGTNVNAAARKKSAVRTIGGAARSAGGGRESGGTAVLDAPADRHPLKVVYNAHRLARVAESGLNTSTRELAATVLKEPAFELRNEISSLRTMVESLLQRTANNTPRQE